MARQPGDKTTLDLLSWEPPELVERYEETRVRAASLRSKVALAVSATLKDGGIDRATIAKRMSAWLGEDVSKNMLDAYSSEAREEQTIPYIRLLALVHVTGDMRLMQLGAELFGFSVVDDKFLPWVEAGQLAEKRDEIQRELEAARRRARRRP